MNKKIITLILCMLPIMLTACGNTPGKLEPLSSQDSTAATTTVAQSESKSETTTKADESSQEETTAAKKKKNKKKTDDTDKDAEKSRAQEVFESLTLDEKIGQLFIVDPETLNGTVDEYELATGFNDSIGNNMKAYPVGGIIHFAVNIIDPDQIQKFNSGLQKASKVPLMIAVDEEGGTITRIASNDSFDVKEFPDMYEIGATGDTANAEEVGETIGAYLKDYGFNVDFAPVSDVFTNPDNTVIGERAFSSDADTAAEMVSACIEGFHKSGMICTIKHFPGHGDTDADSHLGYVSVSKTWDELKECELIPFIENKDSTDMIMAAHITLPNITGEELPATLSKDIITDKLRNEIGYDGVIITDSMKMGAISTEYESGDATVKALQAGVDIILMPASLSESFEAVKAALDNGTLDEERIDESVMRILRLKEKYDILK